MPSGPKSTTFSRNRDSRAARVYARDMSSPESPNASTPDDREQAIKDKARFEYFDMGLQYHVAARFLLLEVGHSVSGKQAHHAIEMYLKGLLCPTTTELERMKLGHNLPTIWAMTKPLLAQPVPDLFDTVVETLEQFEKIRYPERIFRKGALMQIGWERFAGPVLVDGRQLRAPRYELFMNEVDALADHLLNHSNVNREYLRTHLRPGAWGYLSNRNRSMGYWTPETSNA